MLVAHIYCYPDQDSYAHIFRVNDGHYRRPDRHVHAHDYHGRDLYGYKDGDADCDNNFRDRDADMLLRGCG
jgi:hypothetical protein